MEKTAYLTTVKCTEKAKIASLRIQPKKEGCLTVSPEKEMTLNQFYASLNLLKTGMVFLAYTRGDKSLIKACSQHWFYDAEQENVQQEAECIFDDWKDIEFIFQHEKARAIYWFSRSLTAQGDRNGLIAVYYAFEQLCPGKPIEVLARNEEEKNLLYQLKETARVLREDMEDREERGLGMPEIAYEPEMLAEAQKLWYNTADIR